VTQWALDNRDAPEVPSITFAEGPPSAGFTSSTNFQHDEHLNTLGGLRSPVLDVPVATYIGPTCGLFGETLAFTPLELARLYPTHDSYVTRMHTSIDSSVRAGLLLPDDANDLMRRACDSAIGGPSAGEAGCPAITGRSPYGNFRG
jgi:hypothetical protein